MTFKNESLTTVLATLRDSQSEYAIHFIHNDLEHLQVSARVKGMSLPDAVKRVCKEQPVKVKTRGKQIFVQYKSEKDLSGKTVHLSGAVEDGFLEMPLPKAKVSVLRTDSSTVVDSAQMFVFYGSGMKIVRAQFGADVNAAEREYLLRVCMDGYDDLWKRVSIPRPLQDDVDVPTLKMRRSTAKTLHEVTVSATKIKMFYRGDTLIYDATAFKMPEGSMLDDLIRQLPGVTLNADGEIFVNGRKVDELLLGSRTFFGGNKRVLMENLPYYTVKHLKVYEKQTDMSEALGYDVEPRKYVMDVNLKEEYKRGYIGNVEAAGGTDERWLGRAFLLGFTDRLRFTLLGNLNNVNEGRHIGQSDQWSPARQPRSLTTTRSVAAEIDYSSKGDKLRETFRAEYTSTTDKQAMTQRQEQFLAGSTPMSLTESFSRQSNGRLRIFNAFQLKKPTWIYATASIVSTRRDGTTSSSFEQWDDTLTATLRSVGLSRGSSWNGHADVQGAVNVGKKGRLTFFVMGDHSKDDVEQATRYEQGITPSTSRREDVSYNTNDISNRSTSVMANVNYNLELAEDLHLMAGDGVTYMSVRRHDYLYHPDTLLLSSQIDALAAITDPHNSYDSHFRSIDHRPGITLYKEARVRVREYGYKLLYQKFSFGLGLPIRHERLHYRRGMLDTLAVQRTLFLNPTFSFRHVTSDSRHDIRLNVEHRRSAPELTDRITFRDDSQPLIVKLGNPDLKPTMLTTFSLQYYDQNAPNQGQYNLSASFDYHHRDVAQSLTYDPATGVRTYKPMNVSGAYVARADFGTDHNIGEKRYWSWHVDAGADWNHSKDHAMMEGETESSENVVNTLTLNNRAHIRFNRKTVNVRVLGNVNWRHSEGRMRDFSTLNALDFQYGFEARYTTPALSGTKVGGLTLAADATMYSRRGYGSALMNTNDFVLNASLSQPFMNGKLIFRLEAFDLRHQLSATDYIVNAQGRAETYYRSLPHYLMLHAVWHFNKNPRKE
ncbi:MAG: outer membrane beta-barrel protein [Prevotella sp.]|nr:outer membrane beta-barrel protein [Prevotella sp.]